MNTALYFGGVVELIDVRNDQTADKDRYCAPCLPAHIPDIADLVTDGMRAIIHVSEDPKHKRYCAACGEACVTARPDTLNIPRASI